MKTFARQHLVRERRDRSELLEDVLSAIDAAPVREQQIRDDELFVFGDHDMTDGSITLNVPLLRVLVYLHEGTHRVRPEWSERTVRARSVQLLHALTDDDVARVNKQLVAAIRTGR